MSPVNSEPSDASADAFDDPLEDQSTMPTVDAAEQLGPENSIQTEAKKVQVDPDIFYNEETVKYMKVIDAYKKLGVGRDIELPRVFTPPSDHHSSNSTNGCSLSSLGLRTVESLVCWRT